MLGLCYTLSIYIYRERERDRDRDRETETERDRERQTLISCKFNCKRFEFLKELCKFPIITVVNGTASKQRASKPRAVEARRQKIRERPILIADEACTYIFWPSAGLNERS